MHVSLLPISLLTGFFMLCCMGFAMRLLLPLRQELWRVFAFAFACLAVLIPVWFLSSVFLLKWANALTGIVVMQIAVLIIFRGRSIDKVKSFLLVYVVLILWELGLAAIYLHFHPMETIVPMNTTIAFSLSESFLCLGVVYGVKHFNLRVMPWILQTLERRQLPILVAIGFMCMVALCMLNMLVVVDSMPYWPIAALAFLLFAVLFGMMLSAYQRETKRNNELTLMHETLSALYDQTQAFRHDYRNTMYAIHGYMEHNDHARLSEYMASLMEELAQGIALDALAHATEVEDGALRHLMIAKSVKANQSGVTLRVRALRNLDGLGKQRRKMIEILGIALDNAIEAASCVPNAVVSLSLCQNECGYVLEINNPVAQLPDLHTIFQKHASTKLGHSGIGLYRVKALTRRDDAWQIDITCESMYFFFRLFCHI